MKKNILSLSVLLLAGATVSAPAADLLIPFYVNYAISNYSASGTVGAVANRAAGAWLGNLRGQETWRDLIIANDQDNTVTVRICTDEGTFLASTNYAVGLNPRDVVSGQLTGDAYEDIVVANYGTNTVSVLANLGKGNSFGPAVNYTVGSTTNPGPIGVVLSDIDGNNSADIVVANALENSVSILMKTGTVFVLSTNYSVGTNPQSVQLADLDGDGRNDIFTANKDAGTLTILPKLAGSTFGTAQTVTLFPGGDPQPMHALAADLNGDTYLDIVTANYNSNSVSILINNGIGSFSLSTNYGVGLGPRRLLLRDLNNDGQVDISVVAETSGELNVLLGIGGGSFISGYDTAVGSSPSTVVGSHFNNDKVADLAVANNGDNTVSVLVYDYPRVYSNSHNVLEDATNAIKLLATVHTGRTGVYSIVSGPAQGTLTGTAPNLNYVPATNYFGPDSFTFKVNDGFTDSEVATINLNVAPVNDAPEFTVATNLVRVQKYGVLNVVSNLIATSSPGPANESSQTISYLVTVTNGSFYALKPYFDSAGTMRYKTYAGVSGTNVISVRAQDSGGVLNGGTNRSPVTTISIVSPPNPYPAIKGTYNGLFYENSGVTHESSGYFKFSLSNLGTLSGSLRNGPTYALRGQFDADGNATVTVNRLVGGPLTLNLTIDLVAGGTEQVSGTVTDGNWTATLLGDRAVFHSVTNPAPQAGKYTMVIPGNIDPAAGPGGDGYAIVTVSTNGTVKMSGLLGDGRAVSQTALLSKNGQWPFYASLYSTKGSLISWLTFSNQVGSSFSGNLSWIKTFAYGSGYYPGGFTNEAAVAGSSFTPAPIGERLLALTNAITTLSGGNLALPLVNNVVLNANNTVTSLSGGATNLYLTIGTNGLFSGAFKDPGGVRRVLRGVVLQQQNTANGFFLGTTQSGAVILQ